MITAFSLIGIFLLAVDAQVFPSILTRLGGSPVQEGLLLAAMFVFFPLSSVAAGTLADRIGKRGVIAAGILLVALSFAASATFPDIQARTLAVLLFGLGGGVVESQISALLSDLNPKRERAVMNLSQTLFSAGAAGGPFLISLVSTLSRDVGLSPLLWTVGAVNFLLFALFAAAPRLAAPARRSLGTHRPGSARAAGDSPGVSAASPPEPAAGRVRPQGSAPAPRLLRDPLLWILALGVFLYVAAEMGTAGWLAKFGETELGLPRQLAPLCLTLFWGGLGLSRTLVAFGKIRWSDRGVLIASLVLTTAGQVTAFSVGSPAVSLAAIAVAGLGMGAVWPTLVALAAVRFRTVSGTAVGIVVAAGALATPIVQYAVGLLSRPGLLGLRNSLLSLAILTVLDLVLVLAVFRRGTGTRFLPVEAGVGQSLDGGKAPPEKRQVP